MGKRKLFCLPLNFFDFLHEHACTAGVQSAQVSASFRNLREKFFRGLPKNCDFSGVRPILASCISLGVHFFSRNVSDGHKFGSWAIEWYIGCAGHFQVLGYLCPRQNFRVDIEKANKSWPLPLSGSSWWGSDLMGQCMLQSLKSYMKKRKTFGRRARAQKIFWAQPPVKWCFLVGK